MTPTARREVGVALLGAGLLAASCGVEGGNVPVSASADGGSSAAASEPLGESPAAATRIAELRARFRLPVRSPEDARPELVGAAAGNHAAPTMRSVLGEPVAARFEASEGPAAATHVRAVLPRDALRGVTRPAHVALPLRANGEVQLEDATSRISVRFALESVQNTLVEVADGMALYRGALDGADVVHRVHAEGTEDFVVFETRPAREELTYSVDVSRVPGLRLVSNSLEFLDESGTPLLRVAPPYAVDAHGVRYGAQLSVDGCAHDTSPAGPWGRRLTRPGAARCTVRVAWKGDLAYPAMVDPAWGATGSMAIRRYNHTASALPSGKVLVAGGYNGSTCLASAELFDPASNSGPGTFAATGPMTATRRWHSASVLASGKVLVAGGSDSGSTPLATAELFDAGAGAFVPAGAMVAARWYHTASVLLSGKVLLAGGYSSTYLASAEIYDPAGNAGSGSFAATSPMLSARYRHTASVLLSGKVLVAGGRFATGDLASAELFDPTGNAGVGTFAGTGVMATARQFHTASVLPSGKVLVAGGLKGTAFLATAELFDPAGTFAATGAMTTTRESHTASVLPSGKVLVAGGDNGPAMASAELFDPAGNAGAGTFAATTPMATPRSGHTASVLPSGKVLVAGGAGATYLAAEVFGGALADACTASAYCLSGFCADGRCCNAACSASCDRCDLPGKEGTCAVAPPSNPGANPACAFPLACDGVKTTCPTSCATDAACAPSYYCAPDATCQSRKPQAAACDTTADCKQPGCRECASGSCADGVCCDRACTGQCEACDSGDAVCRLVSGKPHGSRPACTDGKACGTSTSGCEVGAAVCDGEHTVTDDKGAPHDCAPYRCDSKGTCRDACTSVNDCVAPAICDANGTCAAPPDSGSEGGCALSAIRSSAGGASSPLPCLAVAAGLALARRRRRRCSSVHSA